MLPENKFSAQASRADAGGLNVGGTALRRDPSANKVGYSSHYRRLDAAGTQDPSAAAPFQPGKVLQRPPLAQFPQMNLQRPMQSDSRPSNASMNSTQESLKRGALTSASVSVAATASQWKVNGGDQAEKIELDPSSEYMPTVIERSTHGKGF